MSTAELEPTPTPPSLSSGSGNAFPLFPYLPLEIRLQIWSFALSSPSVFEPRTVHIACHRAVHPIHRRRYAQTFSTSTPPPPLLVVNHEARSEALRVYRPHFDQIPVVQVDDVQPPLDRLTSTSRLSSSSSSRAEEGGADEARTQRQHGNGNTNTSLLAERASAEDQESGQKPNPTPKPQSIYIAFNRETLRLREDVLSYIPELELGLIERMVVDVADVYYFGHFYLEIIRSMDRLRMLDLVVDFTHSDRVSAGRGAGVEEEDDDEEIDDTELGFDVRDLMPRGISEAQRERLEFESGVESLLDEFMEMRESDPEWDCPDVSVVLRDSGAVVGDMAGGRGSSMDEDVGILV